jgi:hypothetical protein
LGMNRPIPPIEQVWNLIREEEGDTSFSEPCPAEDGSDASLFPHHRFTLNSSHGAGSETLMRFCVHCGLSHRLTRNPQDPWRGSQWKHIKENEQDPPLSGACVRRA